MQIFLEMSHRAFRIRRDIKSGEIENRDYAFFSRRFIENESMRGGKMGGSDQSMDFLCVVFRAPRRQGLLCRQRAGDQGTDGAAG